MIDGGKRGIGGIQIELIVFCLQELRGADSRPRACSVR